MGMERDYTLLLFIAAASLIYEICVSFKFETINPALSARIIRTNLHSICELTKAFSFAHAYEVNCRPMKDVGLNLGCFTLDFDAVTSGSCCASSY